MSDPATDAAIAWAWPDRWLQANDPTRRNRSKARNNLRKSWSAHLTIERLKTADSCCGNCDSFAEYPNGGKMICQADSDFHGYAITTADKICTQWRPTLAKGESQ